MTNLPKYGMCDINHVLENVGDGIIPENFLDSEYIKAFLDPLEPLRSGVHQLNFDSHTFTKLYSQLRDASSLTELLQIIEQYSGNDLLIVSMDVQCLLVLLYTVSLKLDLPIEALGHHEYLDWVYLHVRDWLRVRSQDNNDIDVTSGNRVKYLTGIKPLDITISD